MKYCLVVSENHSNSANPTPKWPFILPGAVIAGVALAIAWISAEVNRVRRYQSFDYRPHTQTNDSLAEYRDALNGGDATAGREVFFNKPVASCGRCHRVGGQGGDNGPVLDGVALRLSREELLESLIKPNAKIAEGFQSLAVGLTNGRGVVGVLRAETDNNLVIHTPDDGEQTISKADIVRRTDVQSPMPDNFASLISTNDLRDLVAFLSSLTNHPPRD